MFCPKRDMPGYYNLWRGFAVEPREGDCSKFLSHIRDNVCQGNATRYAWTMAWLADIVQHPGVKPGTSLVLRGLQGTGKTIFGQVYGSLLGQHYRLVANSRYVTGRFNSHMKGLLLLHADEAFWAGNRDVEGTLKDLVTGDKHPIEPKYNDSLWVDNHMRLLVSGNQDWQVPAGPWERRFTVLDMGDAHMQDHVYFGAIVDEMNNGGREALLYHLLHEVDCTKVDVRQVLHTAALLEQKIASAKAEESWWLDVLHYGALPGSPESPESDIKDDDAMLPNEAPFSHLYEGYVEHTKNVGASRRMSETQLGIFLHKVAGPELHKGKRGGRRNVYAFPSLSVCRRSFAQQLGQGIRWKIRGDWR